MERGHIIDGGIAGRRPRESILTSSGSSAEFDSRPETTFGPCLGLV